MNPNSSMKPIQIQAASDNEDKSFLATLCGHPGRAQRETLETVKSSLTFLRLSALFEDCGRCPDESASDAPIPEPEEAKSNANDPLEGWAIEVKTFLSSALQTGANLVKNSLHRLVDDILRDRRGDTVKFGGYTVRVRGSCFKLESIQFPLRKSGGIEFTARVKVAKQSFYNFELDTSSYLTKGQTWKMSVLWMLSGEGWVEVIPPAGVQLRMDQFSVIGAAADGLLLVHFAFH